MNVLQKMLRTKKGRKQLISLVVLLVSFGIVIAQNQGWIQKPTEKIEPNPPGLYTVTGFADGDTISVDMNGTKEQVRFIGVDTPEVHDPRKAVQCFGKAASEFTKNLIGSNTVRLESDPKNTDRDKYNRLLRYVYLPDGTLVNAEIIKQGYGFAYLSFPTTKDAEFRGYEQQAREAQRGLWGSCQPVQNQSGGYTSNPAEP